MTEKLQQFFNLPDINDVQPEIKTEELSNALAVAQEIETSLPTEPEDSNDNDLDNYAKKAMEAFENLQSLGMNTEPRFSAPIFDSASKMLGHAITAKLGKAQKKLKETELKMRLLKQQNVGISKEENTVSVEAKVWDRNQLLESLKNNK